METGITKNATIFLSGIMDFLKADKLNTHILIYDRQCCTAGLGYPKFEWVICSTIIMIMSYVELPNMGYFSNTYDILKFKQISESWTSNAF